MERESCILLYTRQADAVAAALQKDGIVQVKKAYVAEKYGAEAKSFQIAYGFFRELMAERIPPETGEESPYWLHGTALGAGVYGDGQLLVLNAPRKDCLFFDSRRWNRVPNLSYLGKEKDEEEAFEKELRRVGVFHCSQVFLTPFYPVQRQEILNSWRRNLLIPPEELAYLQAVLWRLKKEWLVN